MNEKPIKTEIKRDDKGLFLEGTVGGPGRPELTDEEKIIKKEVKAYIKEHIDGLAESLPEIKPSLITEAKKGNILAIKEIHDRVMGKAVQPVAVAVKAELTFTQRIKQGKLHD